ncbi:Acyl-CoA N-acyltransferase protein [Dioscorea alata]|uniref:Acyl-CoA N-acyltransferase protein n=1 Tax=Dioscorea alata TaxID=55571 RepID=A0ACB7VR36_DIOAL|nr:Acyl-CoA N-acyltransferase protein [Dioscorea alata]
MARKRRFSRSFSSPIPIGNCRVEIESKSFACEPTEKQLTISVSAKAKINISVDDSMDCRGNLFTDLKCPDVGKGCFLFKDCSFFIVNPKNADEQSKSLLQETLKIYTKELPTMNYAANTGRESLFLEKSLLNGKYNTLILRSSPCNTLEEVVAAVSYQIIPANTQYAEIPLAAVSSSYQNKGIGKLLFKELRDRLQKVGVSTILCWGDDESEGFWLKQGFISIDDAPRCNLCVSSEVGALLPSTCVNTNPGLVKAKLEGSPGSGTVDKHFIHQIEGKSLCHVSVKNGLCEDKQAAEVGISAGAGRMPCCGKLVSCSKGWCNATENVVLEDTVYDDADGSACNSGKGVKRQISEALSSSLKSKRVRGSHYIQCCPCSSQIIPYDGLSKLDSDTRLGILPGESCDAEMSKDLNDVTHVVSDAKGNNSLADILVSDVQCAKIMFMNIADEMKKASLAKVVHELGGSVTCDGNSSTHVIAGKVRRTLNFSTALCSGAWIVSPNWLKASFRERKFLGEEHYILEDEDYLSKYKCKLKDAVLRAKANPCSLLNGYHFCLARHIQPSFDILSTIIKSAGGDVIAKLANIKEPSRTIFLACEEDVTEALAAAKKGVRTFSSDWFMNCIMRQELDLEGPQFAESL